MKTQGEANQRSLHKFVRAFDVSSQRARAARATGGEREGRAPRPALGAGRRGGCGCECGKPRRLPRRPRTRQSRPKTKPRETRAKSTRLPPRASTRTRPSRNAPGARLTRRRLRRSTSERLRMRASGPSPRLRGGLRRRRRLPRSERGRRPGPTRDNLGWISPRPSSRTPRTRRARSNSRPPRVTRAPGPRHGRAAPAGPRVPVPVAPARAGQEARRGARVLLAGAPRIDSTTIAGQHGADDVDELASTIAARATALRDDKTAKKAVKKKALTDLLRALPPDSASNPPGSTCRTRSARRARGFARRPYPGPLPGLPGPIAKEAFDAADAYYYRSMAACSGSGR